MKKKPYLSKLSRRTFVKNSVVAAAGSSMIPSLLTSCDTSEEDDFSPEGDFGFMHGVASFDPTQDRVVLWSRYSPASNETGSPAIILDVATDDAFSNVVASQQVQVDTNSDYTINVDVSNLTSNTAYFYRFRNDRSGAVSITGQTTTLPAPGEKNDIKLAVVSCANFQSGLFNTYGAIARSDVDVVIHLGDYIYEYGEGGYGTNENTASLDRAHQPAGEIISLSEYRERYRQYRMDPQLQRVHQLKPFICVWDDHEVTNDAYKDGAENHQSDEGSYEERKMAAIQVWHEYLPARVDDNSKIYRSFDFGGILNLMMLDTRIVGREKQLDYADYFTANGLDSLAFFNDWQDSSRTILGQEQQGWLISELSASNATWQVLGSQVLMGKINIPGELLTLTAQIASGDTSAELFAQYNTLLTELVTIKSRILQGDPSVTSAERARVEQVLPYNLDAWDGYPIEREVLLSVASGKKLVSLAGDTHNAWYSVLRDQAGNEIGHEFATPSVSSPGFEAVFGDDPEVISGFEQANQVLVDDLQYVDASQRGYLKVVFNQSNATAEWNYINTLFAEDESTSIGNTVTI